MSRLLIILGALSMTAAVKDTDSLLEVLARVSPREVADAFLRRLTQ
jgi:hypothetical protein